MKTRLTAQAMRSFLLAKRLVLPSTSNTDSVTWQSCSCCRRPTRLDTSSLHSDDESELFSSGAPCLNCVRKHHNCQRFLEDFIETFKLTSLKCRDDPQSGVVSRTLLKTPFVSPSQFHSCARESCHLLQTSVIWLRWNKWAANGSSLAAWPDHNNWKFH